MDALEHVQQARDALSVRRVFGKPYERDGLTVIPAASIRGGGGGGGGEHQEAGGGADGPSDTGSGGGFALSARPAGVYVVSGGSVRWQPAIDVNRIVLGGQVVAVVALLTVRSILRLRRRR
jgi:uncharacterized spore protein YtfJ